MTDETQKYLQQAHAEWLAALKAIADFLRLMRPDMTQAHIDHNAAAIIARLSHAGFSLQFDPDIKDATE